MSKGFKILEDEYKEWIFVDKHSHTPTEYITYRHVIAHAIHIYRNTPNIGVKKLLNEFKKA